MRSSLDLTIRWIRFVAAVVEVSRLQELLKRICRNGFEHHAAMNASHTAKILNEAFTAYFGWNGYMHAAS
jgi:hypothetical protein